MHSKTGAWQTIAVLSTVFEVNFMHFSLHRKILLQQDLLHRNILNHTDAIFVEMQYFIYSLILQDCCGSLKLYSCRKPAVW